MKQLSKTLIIILLLSFPISLAAQTETPGIQNLNGKTFAFPWAGGMNSCQFNEVDLDRNGIMDLLVFDRQGNRMMPFINAGIPDSISYRYAPEYCTFFPELSNWFIMTDYDSDGRNDIFAYNASNPGLMVYRNVSDSELKFDLVVYPYLTSDYGSGYVNILVTSADYPAIVDLDNDGDLDILTFWALGAFVELHVNQSMEKYGTPDSLTFKRTEHCWGRFAESEESNIIYLDTCFGVKTTIKSALAGRNRHTGSTFLVTDLDDDQDKDLVLGDVDYPGLIKLTNGGTSEDAYMISQEPGFPANSYPVHLFSMPLAQMIDVNNDGIRDMLVNPFDGATFVSRNYLSSWLYMNSGTNTLPVFEYRSFQFLQEDMIDVGSGAYPLIHDVDSDGLQDLLVGNYGYYDSSWYDAIMSLHSEYRGKLAYFRNTGTPDKPAFQYITDDLAGISGLNIKGIYPAMGDLDGDGDSDLLCGKEDGKLLFCRNEGISGQTPVFELVSEEYQDIDAGQYSTPCLADVNGDQLVDIIIGNKAGKLKYFQNTGTPQNPVFILEDDFWGEINVTDPMFSNFGYSTPFLFQNREGKLSLITGSEQGEIFYFPDIQAYSGQAFPPSDSLYKQISNQPFEPGNGWRMSASIADLNQDGWMELITGNFSGGLEFYPVSGQPGVSGENELENNDNLVQIFPNPARDVINIILDKKICPARILIFNSLGEQEAEYGIQNKLNLNINIANFVNGIHYVVVVNGAQPGNRTVKKLIISK